MGPCKGWFPYDRYDRCDRWQNVQQSLRLYGNHFLAILTITAVIWKPAYMKTAQRLKSPRPLNFFGSDRSDHMEPGINETLR